MGPIGKAELLVNLPYLASAETIYAMPKGGQIEGRLVRWTLTDFEPGPKDDFFIKLLLLNRWDELQASRSAVAANPQDGETWLNLASTYSTLTRGKAYSAARMLPGFGQIFQTLGVQAAKKALRLMPGDGRPHYELALLYASALPENASREDLKPVSDELKIVEELEPALAPNIHDALDFMGAIWVIETARAEASLMPEPSATISPIQKPTLTLIPPSTLIPSTTPQPPPTTQLTTTETPAYEQSLVILVAAGVIVLVIVGYIVLKRLQKQDRR